jgi:hypothetical protein
MSCAIVAKPIGLLVTLTGQGCLCRKRIMERDYKLPAPSEKVPQELLRPSHVRSGIGSQAQEEI